MESAHLVPGDPVRVDPPGNLVASDQAVEVRHTLARSHLQHCPRYGPAEQCTEDIECSFRLREHIEQTAERCFVTLDEIVDATVQSIKRIVMSGKDQDVIENMRSNRGEGLEPLSQRVGSGLCRKYRHVGRYFRQNLVT